MLTTAQLVALHLQALRKRATVCACVMNEAGRSCDAFRPELLLWLAADRGIYGVVAKATYGFPDSGFV